MRAKKETSATKRMITQLISAGVIATAKPLEQHAFRTGVDAVDFYLFGCGGFPRGHRGVTELYGGEGSGKSALCDTAIGMTQRAGGLAFLADTEHARDEQRSADVFGVNFDELGQYMKDTDDESMEHLLGRIGQTLDALPGYDPGSLIVWDSFANTATRAEIESGIEPGKDFDRRAGIISKALRQLVTALAVKGSSLVIVNQPRTKIGTMFGDPTTTPGGQAIKSCASLRVAFYGSTVVKDASGAAVGRLIKLVTKKSRFSQSRTLTVRFDFETGFNDEWTTLNLAKDLDLVDSRTKGHKGLTKAIEQLARKFPGFAAAKADAAKADENADRESTETTEHAEGSNDDAQD